MNIDKIVGLLKKYINDYENKVKSFDSINMKKQFYEDLIPLLENIENINENKLFIIILLSNIYNNETYNDSFYKALYALKNNDTKEYYSLLAQIKFDYKEVLNKTNTLKTQITNARQKADTARRSIFYFQNRRPLFDKYRTYQNIRKIIEYYAAMGEINDKDEIILLNELEFYNRNIISQPNKEKEYAETVYHEVPNILESGFEMYDEIEVPSSRKETLNSFVSEIKTYIEQLNKDEIISLIETYKKYNLEDKEYRYIVNEILKYYLFQALEYYQILLDATIYQDRATRFDAIATYYQLLDKYLIIREYYNSLTNIELIDNDNEDETNSLDLDNNPRKLVFSHPFNNPTNIRLISDLKDIPEEYYQTIFDLLNSFLENKKKTKFLVNENNSKYQELKDDQIRIIMHHLSNNIFCIVGVFIKKSDNDMKMYKAMFNRLLVDISTKEKENQEIELGQIALQKLKNIVDEKARKGTR